MSDVYVLQVEFSFRTFCCNSIGRFGWMFVFNSGYSLTLGEKHLKPTSNVCLAFEFDIFLLILSIKGKVEEWLALRQWCWALCSSGKWDVWQTLKTVQFTDTFVLQHLMLQFITASVSAVWFVQNVSLKDDQLFDIRELSQSLGCWPPSKELSRMVEASVVCQLVIYLDLKITSLNVGSCFSFRS